MPWSISSFVPPVLLAALSLLPAAQEPAGRLVSVGTHRLWIECAGEGAPTIVVEVGGGSNGAEWSQTVDDLRREARVCIYSRAGYPRSEPGPLPRDAGREADELAALVEGAGVTRPFLLVAHSLGALNALVLADRHRDWLSGLVLLDAPPLSWMSGRAFPGIRVNTEASVARMRQRAAQLRAAADSTGPVRAAAVEALASEIEAMFARTPELVSAVRSLGDLPLLVVSGGRANPAVYGDQAEAFTGAWIEQGRAFAALSSRGSFVLVAESGHNLPQEVPDRVLASVREMLSRLRQ
jgi:pimeloyl-ACP methyl ester carboxylesterase